jgi:hypothetical protein
MMDGYQGGGGKVYWGFSFLFYFEDNYLILCQFRNRLKYSALLPQLNLLQFPASSLNWQRLVPLAQPPQRKPPYHGRPWV